jgi:peptidoglycan/LPS O-acetylase OafA/YrhL
MKYIPWLDGLRAIAIALVLLHHNSGPIAGLLGGVNGWIGVDFFFVISGFLITKLLIDERSRTGRISLKRFYLRRVLRIMPAYYVVLVLYFVIKLAVHKNTIMALLVGGSYASDYDLALDWGHMGDLTSFWSLSVEEHFYILWSLVLADPAQPHMASPLLRV